MNHAYPIFQTGIQTKIEVHIKHVLVGQRNKRNTLAWTRYLQKMWLLTFEDHSYWSVKGNITIKSCSEVRTLVFSLTTILVIVPTRSVATFKCLLWTVHPCTQIILCDLFFFFLRCNKLYKWGNSDEVIKTSRIFNLHKI